MARHRRRLESGGVRSARDRVPRRRREWRARRRSPVDRSRRPVPDRRRRAVRLRATAASSCSSCPVRRRTARRRGGHRAGDRRRSASAPVTARRRRRRRPAPTAARRSAADQPRRNDFKATKTGAIRSNRLRVCVTDGTDGACGTTVPPPPDTTAPTGHDRRHPQRPALLPPRAPRELHGTVSADPSGLWAVKIRLTRRARARRCWYFSGTKERFLKRTLRQAVRVQGRRPADVELPAAVAAAARALRARHVRDRQRVQPRLDAAREVPRAMRRARADRRRRRRRRAGARRPRRGARRWSSARTACCAAPKTVKLKQRSVKVGGKRCRVAAATPLSVLAATQLKLGFATTGSCGKRPRDAVGPVRDQGRRRAREGPRRLGLQGRPQGRHHRPPATRPGRSAPAAGSTAASG